MARTLASIQKIISIDPIPGADAIVKATILGWEVVVKKGEFKPGDLCVYFEIDSVLPPHKLWDGFLAQRKYRIRTIRLRGQLSQGLALPVSILKDFNYKGKIAEDVDVEEAIGVQKYESPSDRAANTITEPKKRHWAIKLLMKIALFRWIYFYFYGKERGSFPDFISKTDETRCQSIKMELLEEMRKHVCYTSEKIDGQSGTYAVKKAFGGGFFDKIFNKHTFFVCSRTQWKKDEFDTSWWIMAKKHDIENKLIQAEKDYGFEIALQGEVAGGKIQGNKYKFPELRLFIFNVKDITHNRYFTLNEMKEFCFKYGFDTVPILDEHFDLNGKTVADLVEYAKGKSVYGDTLREGVVIRCVDNVQLSFKAINNDFLEKHSKDLDEE